MSFSFLCLWLWLAKVLPVVPGPACNLAYSLRQELCVTDATEPRRPCLAALCSLAGRGGRVWVDSDKIQKEGSKAARVSWRLSSFSWGIRHDIHTAHTYTEHTYILLLPSLALPKGSRYDWLKFVCVCEHAYVCVCTLHVYTMLPFLVLHGSCSTSGPHRNFSPKLSQQHPNWSPCLTP